MIKSIQKKKVGEKGSGLKELVKKGSSVGELLDLARKSSTKVVGESKISDKVLSDLVDIGVSFDVVQKRMAADFKIVKEILLFYSKKHKIAIHEGEAGTANVKPKTISYVNPKKLLARMVVLGKKKLFFGVIKVGITEAKKYLGSVEIDAIADTDTEKYGSISFKAKK